MAGSPLKGVLAGTLITGIIQSSTAMTVMTVGLVNAGVSACAGDRVIMGANVGTTLGNGLIALPLGPLGPAVRRHLRPGLLLRARSDRLRNIALAAMGFALIFYGLNLMTGGLKPLRSMPEVMRVISAWTPRPSSASSPAR